MYAKPKVFSSQGRFNGRAGETSARLRQGLCDLLARKPYEQITGSEVADQCGIARSTLYRRWAGLEDILWSLIGPVIGSAIRASLDGDLAGGASRLGELWKRAGLAAAFKHHGMMRVMRRHTETLVACEVERRFGGRRFEMGARFVAASLVMLMSEQADASSPDSEKLRDLLYMLYVSALMTPRAIEAAARIQAERIGRGRFPAAVSASESLASDEHIISMIDGRPYRSLRRHLTRYGMTPDRYRQCFELPDDYPMVAKAYSDLRRSLARSQLGGRRAGA